MNLKGFTLIEVLIAVSLIGIIGAVGGTIFAAVIRSYNKTQITNELQQNGEMVLSKMEQAIRNASEVTPISSSEGSWEISVKKQAGSSVTFGWKGPAGGANGYIYQDLDNPLTNTNPTTGVSVVGSSVAINQPDLGKPKMVTISLTLQQGANAPTGKDYVGNVTLQTSVVVRGGYN